MNTLCGIFDFCIRMFPGILLGSTLFAISRIRRTRRMRSLGLKSPLLRELFIFLFFLFCSGLAFLTLMPRWFDWTVFFLGPSPDLPEFFTRGTANFIPFRTFRSDTWSLMILAGNIVMFIPIGFFPSLFCRTFTWGKTLLLSLAVTLFIECWQFIIGRSFDIDDLLLNMCGFLLGRFLFGLLPQSILSRFDIQSSK